MPYPADSPCFLTELLVDFFGNAKRVCRNGKRWVDARARRKERRIDDVEIDNVVSAIVSVEHTGFRVVTEPAGAADVAIVEVVFTGQTENLVRT